MKQTAPELGVSFSIKYCRDLGLDWQETLLALRDDLGVRRFRLMSYWDLTQPNPGEYRWGDLDRQMEAARQAGAVVTLAIGLRQPHYPECHPPPWVKDLSRDGRDEALCRFVSAVVERYRTHPALESWQLENEALNRGFGECGDYGRRRLRREFALVKRLDKLHPVIMSTSNSWGVPLRAPRPDVVGFSLYRRQHHRGRYVTSPWPDGLYRWRAQVVRHLLRRRVIIHELQAEPWGPGGTQTLSLGEQDRSMNVRQLQENLAFARATGIRPIDLWGAEWWYWRKLKHRDPSLWEAASRLFAADSPP
ncbi:hypothetical protein KY386_00945 [Candidatus Parcubacteria bacterium]|nr:hypothetical protein [Candidatus Parcubacteria bacterium]